MTLDLQQNPSSPCTNHIIVDGDLDVFLHLSVFEHDHALTLLVVTAANSQQVLRLPAHLEAEMVTVCSLDNTSSRRNEEI